MAERVIVLTIQQNNVVGMTVGRQQIGQITLGTDRFGEDDRFTLAALVDDLIKRLRKGTDQLTTFGIFADFEGECAIAFQLGDLRR